MTYSNRIPGITRRLMLTGFGATLTFGLTSTRVIAGGGGRDPESTPDSSSDDGIEISDKPARKPAGKTRVKYTQKNFHNIRDKDLKTAIKGIDSGHEIWVEGFSKKMSRNLFQMALLDRSRTNDLIKYLATKKTKSQRSSFLWNAYGALQGDIDELEREARKGGNLGTVLFGGKSRTERELDQLKAYKKLMNPWAYSPMEGTLKN